MYMYWYLVEDMHTIFKEWLKMTIIYLQLILTGFNKGFLGYKVTFKDHIYIICDLI